MNIQEELFKMQDLGYRDFHSKLMPTINPDTVIGVRVPHIRQFAKSIKDTSAFLNTLPHKYYEENNLHGILISNMSDFDECIMYLSKFLPYVDNWATCDLIRPKCFRKNTDKLLLQIKKWLNSKDTYTVRFAIEMLMVYYLDDEFDKEFLDWVAGIRHEEYYINMMIAWYFATALAKQYESAVIYILENKMPPWVQNKTIQKAVESYRISPDKKAFLKSLKRTEK